MIKGLDMKTPSPANTHSAGDPAFGIWLVILVTFMSVLLGCGSQNPNTTTQTQGDKPAAKHGAQIVALEKPNEYLVSLRWEKQDAAEKCLIHRRESTSSNLTQVALLDGEEVTFEDKTVTAGATYTYFVSNLVGEKLNIRSQMTVTVPKDLVVTGQRNDVRELLGINRLYLTANSKVLTGAEGITIQVNELHSDFGTIETFEKNDLPRQPEVGRNAGRIEIHAKSAFGTLRLANRGQTGASGIDGIAGAAGAQGEQGVHGDWGMNQVLYTQYHRNFIDSFERAMRQRPEPPGSPRWDDVFAGGVRRFVCARPPANGAQGKPGARGGDGGNGTDGGNAAWVLLKIEKPSTLIVDDIVEGGAPGKPGSGATGGIGGPGGAPGNRDAGHLCPPAAVGPQGPNGSAGNVGAPGKQGLKQPVCFDVAGQKSEGCRHFKTEGA